MLWWLQIEPARSIACFRPKKDAPQPLLRAIVYGDIGKISQFARKIAKIVGNFPSSVIISSEEEKFQQYAPVGNCLQGRYRLFDFDRKE